MLTGHLCIGGPLDGQAMAKPDYITQFNVAQRSTRPFALYDPAAAEEAPPASISYVTYTLTRRADGELVWLAPMWTLMHVHGCGRPCSKRTSRPLPTDRITAEPCRHLDGSQVLTTDPVICESCGEPLDLQAGDLLPDKWIEDVL